MVSVINEAMIDKIYNGKNVELTITGHSLGGAAACVAYADLFVDPNTDLWADTSNAEPLQKGMRIYDQAELDAWSDLDIQGLLTNTNVYTFGAPSFLIEPTKPNGGEWLGLGFDLAKDAIKGNGWDFFYTLGDAVADAVIVNESLLNDALKPALSQYWQHVFQFEHENTDPFTLFDPVSSIGSDDAGTVIDLNLDSSIYARYKHLGIPILFMHQMGNYAESIARLLTGADLIKTNNPLSSNTPLLNQASTTGSTGNDFLLNPTTGFGYAGNDVFVANESGSFNFNGGTGDDAYTISEYGVNLTLTGPTNERTDYLYFNLLAHV